MKNLTLLLGGALLVGSALAPALQAQTKTMTNEDFRRQPPVPLASKPLNLPKPYETKLANGLQVIIVEDKRLPLVSYRLAFKTGSANDPADMPGLLSMTAGLLDEGTATRTSEQISDEVAKYGATLNASAGSDFTTVTASSLTQYSDKMLALLADVVLNPAFPEKELSLARANRKQGLVAQRAQAGFLASEQTARVLYGAHPYSIVSSTPAALDAMTRDKLVAYHKQTFIPNNAVFMAVGNVNREALLAQLNNYFGKWTQGTAAQSNFPAPPVRSERGIYIVDRPGSAQANIVLANLALERNNPDYFPVLVMNQVLGAGASSRLFLNIREQKGYTYGAYSGFDARRLAGNFRSTAEVRTDVTGPALKEFFYEFDRIRKDIVPDEELKNAKSYLTGVFPLRLESQEAVLGQLTEVKLYGLPADYLYTYRDQVNAVTPAEVQRVAQKYLQPDQMAVIIVGDAGKITDQVKPYSSKIAVFDSNGQLKEAAAAMPATGGLMTGGSSAMPAAGAMTAAFVGKWQLTIAAPGQDLPGTLTLTQDSGQYKGSVLTALGDAPLSNVKVTGNNMNANLTVNVQGENAVGQISGSVNGSEIKGEVALPGFPPITFTGKKNN